MIDHAVLRSETALRQGVLPLPYQQVFEVNTGMQDFTCTFKGVQRQFDWPEISIVYDKSYQHTTIFDSYDLQLAAKLIKSIKFENTSSTYSFTRKLSDHLEKEEEKFLLYKILVAHSCDGCSSALLTQYKSNPIYQEITDEDKFTDNTGDDHIYIDMRITGFSQAEYWYLLSSKGYIMSYKKDNISKADSF